MPDDLVPPFADRLEDLRVVVVQERIRQMTCRQLQLVEELKKAPYADPITIFSPAPVALIGRRQLVSKAVAKSDTKGETLNIDSDIESEALASRPNVIGSPRDRRIAEAIVARQSYNLIYPYLASKPAWELLTILPLIAELMRQFHQ